MPRKKVNKTDNHRKKTGYICKLAEYNPYHNTPEGVKQYCKSLGINMLVYNNYIYNYNMPRLQRAIMISQILGRSIDEIWIKEEQ